MTLYEMSYVYREDAMRFRLRITMLREQEKAAEGEDKLRLRQRILELRQSHELADLTRHYYERGYYRNEKYTL